MAFIFRIRLFPPFPSTLHCSPLPLKPKVKDNLFFLLFLGQQSHGWFPFPPLVFAKRNRRETHETGRTLSFPHEEADTIEAKTNWKKAGPRPLTKAITIFPIFFFPFSKLKPDLPVSLVFLSAKKLKLSEPHTWLSLGQDLSKPEPQPLHSSSQIRFPSFSPEASPFQHQPQLLFPLNCRSKARLNRDTAASPHHQIVSSSVFISQPPATRHNNATTTPQRSRTSGASSTSSCTDATWTRSPAVPWSCHRPPEKKEEQRTENKTKRKRKRSKNLKTGKEEKQIRDQE